MPWLGIWFEHEAGDGGARSPEYLRGLVPPIVYPYVHGFIEAETRRLTSRDDPSTRVRDGERHRVFYSLNHDGGLGALDQQGCRILNWLFQNFDREGRNRLSARFSEIPLVVHAVDPARAAALGNALTLLRFLGAREDQAIAKILILPWDPLRTSAPRGAEEYEKRVLEFLHGDVLYPDGVTMFDVLARRDLRAHRALPPCCEAQMGFIRPILEWIDECWPDSETERRELEAQLRNSLADEARYWKRPDPPSSTALPETFR